MICRGIFVFQEIWAWQANCVQATPTLQLFLTSIRFAYLFFFKLLVDSCLVRSEVGHAEFLSEKFVKWAWQTEWLSHTL